MFHTRMPHLGQILFIGAFVLSFPGLSHASFTDVPKDHPQYKAIESLESQKLISGYADGTFKPGKLITQTEFLKLVFNDVGYKPVEKLYHTEFKDVPEGSWYAPYVRKALDLNIFRVSEKNSNFFPEKPLSKIESIRIAFALEGIPTPYEESIKSEDLFKDVKPNASFAYIAKAARKNGVISAKNPDIFSPYKNITRGDASEIIYSIQRIKRITSQGGGTLTVTPAEEVFTGIDSVSAELINNPKFPILLDVWKKANVDFYYKENIDQNELIYGAIEGMTDKMKDKYTIFQEPLKASELTEFLQGEFEGIGTTLDLIDNQLIILDPLPDSPAEKAGVRSGDVIKKIDGTAIENLTLENVLNLIKGKAGTKVRLTISRNGQILEIEITRAKISLSSLTGKIINGNIGYINIQQFLSTTKDEFTKVMKNFGSTSLKGIIIDLRGNPGGYLNSAIDMLDPFVAAGKVVVSTKTAYNVRVNYFSKGPGDLAKYPIVVLINSNTASAAEIMAGALQDYKIAKLVGEKSFGKGSVQELFRYTDSSILKMSIAHWLTPYGKDIHGEGLIPDITVDKTKEDVKAGKDPQLDRAITEIQGTH